MNKVNEGDNISAGVLIRGSCTKVLEPIDIIPSKNNGSNTIKTKPGWCTVGLLDGTRNSQGIHCKQIAVKQDDTKDLGTQHFYTKISVGENMLRDCLQGSKTQNS